MVGSDRQLVFSGVWFGNRVRPILFWTTQIPVRHVEVDECYSSFLEFTCGLTTSGILHSFLGTALPEIRGSSEERIKNEECGGNDL